MVKRKKPNLDLILQKVDQLPKSMFGNVEIDISTLPCLKKVRKEKITANFDEDLLKEIRNFAKKHHVSYTLIMNDALRTIFMNQKNKL